MEKHNAARRVCVGLFLAYLGLMVYLLFLQRSPSELPGYNLMPLRTIRQMVFLMEHNREYARFAFINLFGNVLMFVPLGLLPAIWRKQRKFGCYILTVAVLILLVELTQYWTALGAADIDDWLCNMLGAGIGYLLWRLFGVWSSGAGAENTEV